MARVGEEGRNFLPARFCANTVFIMPQETVITKKRRGPAPTGKGTLIGVRLLPPVLNNLDAWIAAQPEPRPSRPAAIRQFLELGLKAAKGQDTPTRSRSGRGEVERIYATLHRVSPEKPTPAEGASSVRKSQHGPE